MTTVTQYEELNDGQLEIRGGAINGETVINVPVKAEKNHRKTAERFVWSPHVYGAD